MDARALIVGCAAETLTDEERLFLAAVRPWGLILFRRNCGSPEQVAALVADFRRIVGRADAPVLIDQEGGRVQRLGPPLWPAYPAAAPIGRLALADRPAGRRAAWLLGRLLAADLADLGITVDCLPVLDVAAPGMHAVIGDRSFGADPDLVAELGRALADGLMAGGVLPVMKHIPGHGRAGADSHLSLPKVDADRAALAADFLPFRRLRDLPMAMTAHVLYSALDRHRPATTSPDIIAGVIRDSIGFDGLLMSDDLSMKALAGSLTDRAREALAAGCDMLLHCNGKMAEMRELADAAPMLAGRAHERALAAVTGRRAPEPFDRAAGRSELDAHLAIAVG